MTNTHGQIEVCTCDKCGHKHRIGEREIALFKGMVDALWRVYKWCEQNGKHEFRMLEVQSLLDVKTYNRFGDWKMFGGLVYDPVDKDGKRLGKGHYGLNMARCEQFFQGEYKIPMRVWKDPLTRELRPEDYKTVREVPNLYEMLTSDSEYIARYRIKVDRF